MIFTTKALHWLTVILSATGGFAAGVGSEATEANFLSAMAIAAACAGSASAILFLVLDRTERPPDRIFRRVVRVMISFALGAMFGLFVGPSIASFTPLDRIAGIYLGGLTGFGIIGILVSPKTMRALANLLVGWLSRKGGGS